MIGQSLIHVYFTDSSIWMGIEVCLCSYHVEIMRKGKDSRNEDVLMVGNFLPGAKTKPFHAFVSDMIK